MDEADIGTGRTTLAIKSAPEGAIYVWPNRHLANPRDMAVSLGRLDLTIISPDSVRPDFLFGRRREVVVDHACNLTRGQWYAIHQHHFWIRRYPGRGVHE